jgi:hypothetical protein
MQWVVVLGLMVAYLALRETPLSGEPDAKAEQDRAREYHALNDDIAHLLKSLA